MEEEKVKEWIIMALRLKSLKESEMALRKEIAESILEGKIKGSKTGTIGRYKLSATAKVNQSIDEELLQGMWKELSSEERACFKFKPTIIAAEYKKADAGSEIHKAIIEKPGAPTLTIKDMEDVKNG